MENLIGKRIRIVSMDDELRGEEYKGREGIVVHVDSMGQLHGTWGSLAVIPETDRFVVLD